MEKVMHGDGVIFNSQHSDTKDYMYRIQVGDRQFRITIETISKAPNTSRLRESVQALDDFLENYIKTMFANPLLIDAFPKQLEADLHNQQKAAERKAAVDNAQQAWNLHQNRLIDTLKNQGALVSTDSLSKCCKQATEKFRQNR